MSSVDGKPAPDMMRDALEEIDRCFEAALFEGWIDAIENGNIETIRDLWYRRLAYAGVEARCALTAPVPPPSDDVRSETDSIYDQTSPP